MTGDPIDAAREAITAARQAVAEWGTQVLRAAERELGADVGDPRARTHPEFYLADSAKAGLDRAARSVDLAVFARDRRAEDANDDVDGVWG